MISTVASITFLVLTAVAMLAAISGENPKEDEMPHDPQPTERNGLWFGTDNCGRVVGPYDSEYAVRLWHQTPLVSVRGDEDAA